MNVKMTRKQALQAAYTTLIYESNVLAGFLGDYEPSYHEGGYCARKKTEVVFPPRVFIAIEAEMKRLRTIAEIIKPKPKKEDEE
jgi:hypothetical protein